MSATKRRFVLVQTEYTTDYVFEISEGSTVKDTLPDSWIQLSEVFEANVVPMPAADVLAGQLAQVDAAERELRGKFQHELDKLAERRDSLLAISHNGEGDDR